VTANLPEDLLHVAQTPFAIVTAGRRASGHVATKRDARETDEQHAQAAHHGKIQA